MRALIIPALLFLAFAASRPALAEEGLLDGLQQQAKPLLTALGLIGTPYKFAGNTPKTGMDCSGFVRHVYKESNGVELPRSAREISRQGNEVAKDELKPGDLVFFNTLKKPFSHVGIYAGDGRFVHSSSTRSKRVTVSSMDERYWSQRYDGARRLPIPQ